MNTLNNFLTRQNFVQAIKVGITRNWLRTTIVGETDNYLYRKAPKHLNPDGSVLIPVGSLTAKRFKEQLERGANPLNC